MPDITMCMNKGRPLKDKCYRWTAKPDAWQSYSEFGEWNEVNLFSCEDFWDNQDDGISLENRGNE